ncbi:MAG TPA: Gfo/Idh/MocA family oxidoreductase [Candidatus Binatus sp.]|nr:Gfo/Idh/MocA family oxidoreductase [Candidatus Binatus sp.]
MADGPLRIGILGAARIAPMALVAPARRVREATVVAVAAREVERARRFADRHDIPGVHVSYEALLADPDVEAVYVPLPNSLHARWTVRAFEAGKHVLCEKPLAATVAEAEQMARAAARAGRVLMEAFHYRYHPLFTRLRAIIDAGEIGSVSHMEAHLCFPLLRPSDIRYRRDLAGGALMDAGCYTVHLLRHLAGAEPEVLQARGEWTRGGVDRCMEARLGFPDGRTARLTCSLFSAWLLRASATVQGSEGRLAVLNPFLPQIFHRLRVVNAAGRRVERVAGAATYDCQLRAFVAAVRDGATVPTGPADAIANMRAIEAIYAAAGRLA